MLASPLDREGMKKRIEVLLAEVIEDLTDKKSLAEAETVSKIDTIAKILRFFRFSDSEELFHKHADKR